MSAVVIGMDPHKRSATIEVMAGDEAVLGGGRYATDVAGYRDDVADTIGELRAELAAARNTITALLAEPALRALPPEQITEEHDSWALERDTAERLAHRARAHRYAAPRPAHLPRVPTMTPAPWTPAPQQTRGIGR